MRNATYAIIAFYIQGDPLTACLLLSGKLLTYFGVFFLFSKIQETSSRIISPIFSRVKSPHAFGFQIATYIKNYINRQRILQLNTF